MQQLIPFADKHGASLHQEKIAASPGVLSTLRQKRSELIGRSEEAGSLLPGDVRHLYLAAPEAEIAWASLVQAVQAIRDGDLLQVACTCREKAETCGKWLRTRIKESPPQILATG